MAESNLNAVRIEQPAEEADIGVLFIHGIGSQKRSRTLSEFGEPIHAWLTDRFRGLDRQWREVIAADPQGSTLEPWRNEVEAWADNRFRRESHQIKQEPNLLARITEKLGYDTVVGRVQWDSPIDDPNDFKTPAHKTLLFQRRRIEGNVDTERWLLAESWWAETFQPPGFSEFWHWGLHIIPWAIPSHFRCAGPARPNAALSSERTDWLVEENPRQGGLVMGRARGVPLAHRWFVGECPRYCRICYPAPSRLAADPAVEGGATQLTTKDRFDAGRQLHAGESYERRELHGREGSERRQVARRALQDCRGGCAQSRGSAGTQGAAKGNTPKLAGAVHIRIRSEKA
jgi:hypothetical protein